MFFPWLYMFKGEVGGKTIFAPNGENVKSGVSWQLWSGCGRQGTCVELRPAPIQVCQLELPVVFFQWLGMRVVATLVLESFTV